MLVSIECFDGMIMQLVYPQQLLCCNRYYHSGYSPDRLESEYHQECGNTMSMNNVQSTPT